MKPAAASLAGLGGTSAPSTTSVPMPPSRWKSRRLVPALLIAGALAAIAWGSWDAWRPAPSVRVVPVVFRAASPEAAGAAVRAAGWLEPDPFPIYVHALTPGVVERVHVLEGDRVEAGQVVAELVRADAEIAAAAAAAATAAARAAVVIEQAKLAAATESLAELVDRRAAVETAKARAAALEAELVRWAARGKAAAAEVRALEAELARKAPLVESRAVSPLEVETLTGRVEAQRAANAALAAERPVFLARLDEARATLTAAERHAALRIEERRDVALLFGAVAQAEANLALATANEAAAALALARCEVRAPQAGIVLRRLVSPGSRVGEGGAHAFHVVHLYDRGELQARVDVPLADAALVGVDQRAEVRVEALPDRVFPGVVTRLVQEADVAKNTVEVKVSLLEGAPELKPEMLCRVTLLERARPPGASEARPRESAYVPPSLLREVSGERATVWTIGPVRAGRARVEARAVTLGRGRAAGWHEVTDGLIPGDRLVADPPADLTAGALVRVAGEAATSSTEGR